jgi:hypothetical protein
MTADDQRRRVQKSQQKILRNKSELLSIADNLHDLTGSYARVEWVDAEKIAILKEQETNEMKMLKDFLSEQLGEKNRDLERRLAQRRNKRYGLDMSSSSKTDTGGDEGLFSPRALAESKMDGSQEGLSDRRESTQQVILEQQAEELQLLEDIFGLDEARHHAKLYKKLDLRRQALHDKMEKVPLVFIPPFVV